MTTLETNRRGIPGLQSVKTPDSHIGLPSDIMQTDGPSLPWFPKTPSPRLVEHKLFAQKTLISDMRTELWEALLRTKTERTVLKARIESMTVTQVPK